MKTSPELVEKGFVVIALLLMTGAFQHLLGPSDIEAGSKAVQALMACVYTITFVLMARYWQQVIWVLTKEKLILLLVLLALVSAFWSNVPMITLRKSIGLIGTTGFGVYLAMRYRLDELLRLLAWALGLAALLSLLLALALPSYGIMGEGNWRGIYNHKNVLGRIMGLSLIVFFPFVILGGRSRWIGIMWAGFGLSASLLLLSASRTPLLSFLITLGFLPLYRIWQLKHPIAMPPLLITVGIVSASIAAFLIGNLETILAAFGKDLTFTGRTIIWEIIIEMIQKRPWLGYGFGGFWAGLEGGAWEVWRRINFTANHAHNGYLTLGLDLGLIGISIYGLLFLRSFLRALVWARASSRSAAGLFPLLYFTYLLPNNVAANQIMGSNSITWALYVATALSVTFQHNLVRDFK